MRRQVGMPDEVAELAAPPPLPFSSKWVVLQFEFFAALLC